MSMKKKPNYSKNMVPYIPTLFQINKPHPLLGQIDLLYLIHVTHDRLRSNV